jgi:lipopolysaccharide biosynthesis protein
MELLCGVRFDKRPSRDGYVVCLYESMIELCGGISVAKRGGASKEGR